MAVVAGCPFLPGYRRGGWWIRLWPRSPGDGVQTRGETIYVRNHFLHRGLIILHYTHRDEQVHFSPCWCCCWTVTLVVMFAKKTVAGCLL
uniref:Uncharacterized protein n=1 Tax=Anguilla anguilla TaxID=7936 RepID=A0A0E9RGG3_ANGAN